MSRRVVRGLVLAVVLLAGMLLCGAGSVHAQHSGGSFGGHSWGGGSHRSSHRGHTSGRRGSSRHHRSGHSPGSNPLGIAIGVLAVVLMLSTKVTHAVTRTFDEALATRAPRWRHEFRRCGACGTISSSRAPECPVCRRP